MRGYCISLPVWVGGSERAVSRVPKDELSLLGETLSCVSVVFPCVVRQAAQEEEPRRQAGKAHGMSELGHCKTWGL